MKDLLGGKGANLAEMANLGLPVPPGFTITTAVCTHYYANDQKYPKDLEKQVDAGLDHIARVTGRRFGDRANPLLVSVRSGARASMPGMMDTVLNLGLNDDTVEALAKQSGDRRFAYDSYRRFIQMYSNVVLDIEHHNFEDILEDHKSRAGYTLDTELDRRRLGRRGRALPRARPRGEGRAVPAGSARPALGRDRRGVRLVDERARHHLSPPARHSGKLGHRGQRAGHGVRQHGRHLGDRRRLHAQSLDRREAALRRIPDQRPGRGRRRRHPHAAGDHRDRAEGSRLRQAVDGARDARGVQGADAHLRRAREALPRHAGHGVHRRAGQALDAADPQRQAHGQGRAPHRGRTGQREADHQRRSGGADRAGLARSAPAPDHRSEGRAQRHRDRPAGVAGRRLRRDRVQLRRGDQAQGRRQEGHPGSGRDLARGHPRHARRRRHPDDARRHDLPRRGGGARHGQALRLRRGLAPRRLQRADACRPATWC